MNVIKTALKDRPVTNRELRRAAPPALAPAWSDGVTSSFLNFFPPSQPGFPRSNLCKRLKLKDLTI